MIGLAAASATTSGSRGSLPDRSLFAMSSRFGRGVGFDDNRNAVLRTPPGPGVLPAVCVTSRRRAALRRRSPGLCRLGVTGAVLRVEKSMATASTERAPALAWLPCAGIWVKMPPMGMPVGIGKGSVTDVGCDGPPVGEDEVAVDKDNCIPGVRRRRPLRIRRECRTACRRGGSADFYPAREQRVRHSHQSGVGCQRSALSVRARRIRGLFLFLLIVITRCRWPPVAERKLEARRWR